MLSNLAKRWFLLVILGGIALAWFWPESLDWTVIVRPQAVMALSLLLSAWTLESRSLFRALLRPGASLWAVGISYGFLPAFAWLTGYLLPIEDFRIGLMISASVPCTLASAVLWTRMAGGNEAAALLCTFLTTGSSWLLTTTWLSAATGQNVQLDTGKMMTDLVLILIVPVVVGQLARLSRSLRWFATEFKKPIGVVGRLLILVIMLRAAHDVSAQLHSRLAGLGIGVVLLTAVVCLGNHLVALVGGFWSSHWLGFDRATAIAVALAGSQKTLPVSLVLLELYFRDYPLAVVPMLFFHAGQLILDTFIADWWAANNVPGGADMGRSEEVL